MQDRMCLDEDDVPALAYTLLNVAYIKQYSVVLGVLRDLR